MPVVRNPGAAIRTRRRSAMAQSAAYAKKGWILALVLGLVGAGLFGIGWAAKHGFLGRDKPAVADLNHAIGELVENGRARIAQGEDEEGVHGELRQNAMQKICGDRTTKQRE